MGFCGRGACGFDLRFAEGGRDGNEVACSAFPQGGGETDLLDGAGGGGMRT